MGLLLAAASCAPAASTDDDNDVVAAALAVAAVDGGHDAPVAQAAMRAAPRFLSFELGPDDRALQLLDVSFAPGEGPLAEAFFEDLAALLPLRDGDTMERVATMPGARGTSLWRYQQRHRGLRVDGAQVTLDIVDGRVVHAAGRLVATDGIDAAARLDAEQALAALLDGLGQRTYRWEVDPLQPKPAPTPVVYAAVGAATARLAYEVVVESVQPRDRVAAVIAADDDAVLLQASIGPRRANVSASGLDHHNKPVTFTADLENGVYELHEEQSPRTISTRHGTSAVDSVEFMDLDGAFIEYDQGYAVSAHWGAEKFWDYLFLNHWHRDPNTNQLVKWRSYDGRYNMSMEASVFLDMVDANGKVACTQTAWDPNEQRVTFCPDPPNTKVPDVELEVVGHEFSHALTCAQVGGTCYLTKEGWALEEGFADIIGMTVKLFATGEEDWIMGEYWPPYIDEDGQVAWDYRHMALPKTNKAADTYGGEYWSDGEWKHYKNAGVLHRWFYLLTHGGAGINDLGSTYDVKAIGRTAAMNILMVAFRDHLTNNKPSFATAASDINAAAAQAFGANTKEHREARRAWYAVGVSGPLRLMVPTQNQLDVNPWLAELRYSVDTTGEKEWRAELATSPDFELAKTDTSYDYVQLVSGADKLMPGVDEYQQPLTYVVDKVALRPGATYYWRVSARRAQTNAWTPWGGTLSFTTAASKAATKTPFGCDLPAPGAEDDPVALGYQHPWQLKFTPAVTPGATGYIIQIAEDQQFDVPGKLIIDEPVVASSEARFNTPVERKLYWRVAATHVRAQDGEVLSGEWSAARCFQTLRPEVTALVKGLPTEQHPWHVEAMWTGVKGAEGYTVKVRDTDAPGMPVVFDSGLLAANQNATVLGFPTGGVEEHYMLEVTATGPTISKLMPVRETSKTAEDPFWTRSGLTRPQDLSPDNDPNSVMCMPTDHHKVSWDAVPWATGYKLTVYPLYCPIPAGVCGPDFETVLLDKPVAAVPDPNDAGRVSFEHDALGPAQWNAWGTHYVVRAIGPADQLGQDVYAQYFIQPPAPTLLSPQPSGVLSMEGGQLFSWKIVPAPTGRAYYEIFEGTTCKGAPVETGKVHGNNVGVFTEELELESATPKLMSFRVRPEWVSAPCKNPVWSECRSFSLGDTVTCNNEVYAGHALPSTEYVQIGSNKKTISLAFRTYTVHDKISVRSNGQELWTSGCAATPDPTGDTAHAPWVDSGPIAIPAGVTQVEVHVAPNCDPATAQPTTQWSYMVVCD